MQMSQCMRFCFRENQFRKFETTVLIYRISISFVCQAVCHIFYNCYNMTCFIFIYKILIRVHFYLQYKLSVSINMAKYTKYLSTILDSRYNSAHRSDIFL